MRILRESVLALALLAAAVSSGLAQQITLGPKLGLNITTMGGDDAEDFWGIDESRTGVSIGGFLAINVSPFLAIQPEVYFTQKGGEGGDATGGGELKLSYLEIPLLAKLTVPTPARVAPYFLAGPTIAVELSCSIRLQAFGLSERGDCDEFVVETPFGDVPVESKSVDFGLLFGGGVDVALGRGILTFDIRYSLGLSSIDDSDLDTDLKNRAFQITAAYGFVLGV